MTKQDIAINVRGVKKNFQLPHEKTTSIKSSVVNIFRKKDKTVETQHALRDISFEVKKGEFFGILGRNGSGKSTLLKILAEIYQPTKGEVVIDGKLVPFIELGVGFNPELTGRENVYLNGALLGFSKKEIDRKYDDIVKFAELEDFMDQKLKNYSSGMQVRLAFSVATRAEADILLVDEVLAVGDADFQRKCFEFFKSLKKTGKTVVFVTHDMGAVREYCDRGILINEGKITHEGKADMVADEYLKLFNEKTDDSISEDNRWGNGWAKIDSFSIEQKNEKIILKATVKAERDIDGFTFGYRFKNSEGQIVVAGNSHTVKGGGKLRLAAGKKKELLFLMPDFLANDTYTLGATVRMDDKVTICDQWDSITSIKSIKPNTFYSVWAPAELNVKER